MSNAVVRKAALTRKQTVVGANPWVIHRNKEVYGEDVEDFRPDRWLKEDTGDMRMFLLFR
jgi:cytochrome P450